MKKSRFIRVFAAILSVVMLLQLTLPVGAVDETFVRTGAESADMIAAARSQLGYTAPETVQNTTNGSKEKKALIPTHGVRRFCHGVLTRQAFPRKSLQRNPQWEASMPFS